MNIARLYYPVLTLGPGRRLGIWTRGCPRRCPGCMSEDMQQTLPSSELTVENLIRAADSVFSSRVVDGVTISGGEPLAQPEELTVLLRHLRNRTDDILMYTGYTMEEIRTDPVRHRSAQIADVLITGPYAEELNDGRALRGSSNQEIIFNTPNIRERYAPLFQKVREVQIAHGLHDVFLVGLVG